LGVLGVRSHEAHGAEAKPMSEVAFALIKRDIVRCGIAPGSRVTEGQLAERYGLGRAAVRAALSRLYQAGLVHAVSRQGYQIAPITIRDAQDLFGVRLLLEPAASRMAAERIDDRQLSDLEDLYRSATSLSETSANEAYLRTNTEFHVAVAWASGNQRLAELIATLLDDLERFFHLGFGLRHWREEAFRDHRELVEAIRSRDGGRAAAVSAGHIETSQQMVIEAVLRSPGLLSVNLAGAPYRVPSGADNVRRSGLAWPNADLPTKDSKRLIDSSS